MDPASASVLPKDAHALFEFFDEDETGYITVRQAALMLEGLGHYHVAHDEETMRYLVKKYNPDMDGMFSEKKLKALLKDEMFDEVEYVHEGLHQEEGTNGKN